MKKSGTVLLALALLLASMLFLDSSAAEDTLFDSPLPNPAGSMIDLGTLGGYGSEARGINARGQVAGYSSTTAGWYRAFLWEKGTMTDLGVLGGGFSTAYGINQRGQVVGVSSTAATRSSTTPNTPTLPVACKRV